MMTTTFARVTAAALVIAAFAGPAFAATASANLPVNANVVEGCAVTTSAVAFGNVNVTGGTAVDATGGISVTCTTGTLWLATADVGGGAGASYAGRRMTSGANQLVYNLYTGAARTTVWGNGGAGTNFFIGLGTGAAQSVAIHGRVAAAQTGVPAGSYADTVAVTVYY